MLSFLGSCPGAKLSMAFLSLSTVFTTTSFSVTGRCSILPRAWGVTMCYLGWSSEWHSTWQFI